MSVLQEYLTNIANAIREKKETTAPIPAQNFANEILSIGGGSKVTDMPLTITSNGTTEAPEGKRYTPITVAVPKPTLNAPEIYASAGTGNLIVNDFINGIFTSEYLLYVDGEQRATYTEKAIPMQEYIVTGEEQLQVRCKNDTYFKESELSNATTWNFLVNGTPGLTYSGVSFTGLGTVTVKDITIASIVNNAKITNIDRGSLTGKEGYTIRFPDTIRTMQPYSCSSMNNNHIIFGANTTSISGYAFSNAGKCILNFGKATVIPTIDKNSFYNASLTYVVPDNMYDDWIVATNWSAYASKIIRLSEYIAQGGAV